MEPATDYCPRTPPTTCPPPSYSKVPSPHQRPRLRTTPLTSCCPGQCMRLASKQFMDIYYIYILVMTLSLSIRTHTVRAVPRAPAVSQPPAACWCARPSPSPNSSLSHTHRHIRPTDVHRNVLVPHASGPTSARLCSPRSRARPYPVSRHSHLPTRITPAAIGHSTERSQVASS